MGAVCLCSPGLGRAGVVQKQYSPSCLPGARVGLLRGIRGWADGQDERCVFRLTSFAGAGGSTIARTVAHEYSERLRFGATSSLHGAMGMLGMLGSSLQALLCGLRAVYLLYVGTFPILLQSLATFQAGLSVTSGSCSFLAHSQGWTAMAAVLRIFW